jgi:NitT/TauT family transport system ATP-binding protein
MSMTSAAAAAGARYAIELDGVGLTYRSENRSTNALEGVITSIEPGTVTAFVGPSGCGKSSLVKLVAGLIKPSAGRIHVNGTPVNAPRSDIGVAFQNPTMMPWRTVLGNILISAEVSSYHREAFRANPEPFRARGLELLKLVGLQGVENARPWEMSGGMQQRASLCRALIHSPNVMLLDEPFAALDAFTREDLWNVVQDIFLTQKPTIMLITHDLREALYLSDRVLVMARGPGRIIEQVEVTFPRPRTPRTLFEKEFGELVFRLREAIAGTMR